MSKCQCTLDLNLGRTMSIQNSRFSNSKADWWSLPRSRNQNPTQTAASLVHCSLLFITIPNPNPLSLDSITQPTSFTLTRFSPSLFKPLLFRFLLSYLTLSLPSFRFSRFSLKFKLYLQVTIHSSTVTIPSSMASMVSWISEPLPLDHNDAITRALQFSLSETSSSSTASIDQFVLPPEWIGPDLTGHIGSDLAQTQPQPGATGRVAKRKRKSRAMKRNLTTYISTDAANFRQMVQHVTGVDFEFGEPGAEAEPGLFRPEPRRVASVSMQSSCVLPTLDTSAFLLNQEGLIGALEGRESVGLVAGPGRDPVFQMDPLNCFPTLESWSVV